MDAHAAATDPGSKAEGKYDSQRILPKPSWEKAGDFIDQFELLVIEVS
jgi:hypothetical protein